MSKMTKRWLSIVTTLAVAFVMTFGCMGEVFAIGEQTEEVLPEGDAPAVEERAQPEAVVEEEAVQEEESLSAASVEEAFAVKDSSGTTLLDFFYDQKENGDFVICYDKNGETQYLENIEKTDYSGLKNTGGAVNVIGAYGPTISDVLEAAGVESYSSLSFGTNSSKSSTLTKKALEQTRYAFPSILSYAKGDYNTGKEITEEEVDGAYVVEPIINLAPNKNGDPELSNVYGQASPSERNKSAIITGISKITVGTTDPATLDPVGSLAIMDITNTGTEEEPNISFNSVQKIENGDVIPQDSIVGFIDAEGEAYHDTPNADYGIYYTVDGTTPDRMSTLYNYMTFSPNLYGFNFVAAEPGDTVVVKARAISNNKKSSAVKTFSFVVGEKEVADIGDATVSISKATFNGSTLKPAPTVVLAGKTLVKGKDYFVSYSNNVKVGTAKFTVMGKGDYEGKYVGTFSIVPAKAAFSLSTKSRKITVKVTNNTGAAKYQIQYKKKGTSKWVTKTTTSKTYTTSKLYAKKYYYVRVLAVGSAGYSAQKTIKVKR